MKIYVGIDLGTTNSAICTYDGEIVKLYKSPDQNDVTPSAIYIDKRSKYLGKRAYDNAARNPDNSATKFKRMMGTSTPIKLPAANVTMTPEECSAEILRLCFGYLPEEIRNNPDTGTVITVPAAFNQMQKDATMSAAEMAGLGKVALMQEPVAAVMSVMRQRKGDGVFLVYDLGGGTLDVAIAESTSSRVSLLAHGGVAMCGGTDFDRNIFDNVTRPWLMQKFALPDDMTVNPKYKPLRLMATWAGEKAKIELSSRDEAIITLSESELNFRDEAGEEMYLDIPLTRAMVDELIADKVDESVRATRDAMEKANLGPNDIERIVFVGGPTQYKPLREKVAFELGISASTDVNPMTAVAEGAAVFAESIDWASQSRGRKSSRGAISTGGKLDLSFNFIARTPDAKARIGVKLRGEPVAGAEFQIDSLDTGWSSGRMALKDSATLELPVTKAGENTFKVFVFDANGGPLNLDNQKIVITRTAATIDAIPASSSIGIEVTAKGRAEMVYLVREGDALPKKGIEHFRAAESLRAGSPNALHFILREGEITDPVGDNEFIGELSIKGTDFPEGLISQSAELVCEYEVLDSGQIQLNVTVPSIGGSFGAGQNFYSRKVGEMDYSNASKQILDDAETLRRRVVAINSTINDAKLDHALKILDQATSMSESESDPEIAKQAMDDVQTAKKLLADVRRSHIKAIRQIELDQSLALFNDLVREFARPTEVSSFDNLAKTAQRSIDNNTNDFEAVHEQLKDRNAEILWRQDWFIVERFKARAGEPWKFTDAGKHAQLVKTGNQAMEADDMNKLKSVIAEMDSMRLGYNLDDVAVTSNIMRGRG